MSTTAISQEEWTRFFDDFGRQHRGWLATIEEVGPEIGDQKEAARLPLVGISADLKAGEHRITVMLGGSPNADMQRIINAPRNVWFRHSAQESQDALEIESEDGIKTLLQFRFVPTGQTEQQLPENA